MRPSQFATSSRGKIGQTKVKRYWPGKAPEWADDAEEDIDLRTTRLSLDKAFPKDEDGGIPAKDDRRSAASRRNPMRGRKLMSTRRMRKPRRSGRRRIRERQLLREQEELLPQEEEEPVEDEVSEESEYETDSEDEQMGIAMVKPVFIPKSQRDTIAERERLEEEERQL
ncbi:hypothetical protein HU200_066470 [Digitaria exilis]|uniref:Micro-fibrillar-associated protein 1 C-terminal domain-containing protein n=1 Tax=Digitaria exilis TaxID=1010633 RepID=A0A835A6I8_9POAL|nr:hypothetical protein HU200_066470 [Digitaria exilis]